MNHDIRSQFIAHQQHWLLPCALHEADSGGRTHAEVEHAYRTCYQRDRDRITHCSAFRRLDGKTQVFVPHELDHHRTRLTHTLEVAQVARTAARALRANEDVVEAVALAHDLGHPPFGHAGESALDELMANYGHFEHNSHSLRVVDFLEHPYPDFRGLNLTRMVRCCLAKHATPYDASKSGEFDDGLQAPLEGQIVDLADEIAYTSADVADALVAGWIELDQLMDVELWRACWDKACRAMPTAREVHKQIRSCGIVLSTLLDDALAETQRRIHQLTPRSFGDVQSASGRCTGFSAELTPQLRALQSFLLKHVYHHPLSLEKQGRAKKILADLFSAYLADERLLPPRYRKRIAEQGPHRVICDYLAGMTDHFCMTEHEKIVGSG